MFLKSFITIAFGLLINLNSAMAEPGRLYLTEVQLTNKGSGNLALVYGQQVIHQGVYQALPSHVSFSGSSMRVDFVVPLIIEVIDTQSKNILHKIVYRIDVELSHSQMERFTSIWALNNVHLLAVGETAETETSYKKFIERANLAPPEGKITSHIPEILRPEPHLILSGLSISDVVFNRSSSVSNVQIETTVMPNMDALHSTTKGQTRRLSITEYFEIVGTYDPQLRMVMSYRQRALEEKKKLIDLESSIGNKTSNKKFILPEREQAEPAPKIFSLSAFPSIKLCRSFLQKPTQNSELVILKNRRRSN